MALDLVCGMQVEEKSAKWKSEYGARAYYFCSPMCKQKFDKTPEKYARQA